MPVTLGGAARQRKLLAGKKVSIVNTGSDSGFGGKILHVEGDTATVELSVPQLRENLSELQDVTMVFTVPEDATYSVKATVSEYRPEANVLTIVQAEPIQRTEQRGDVRLKTSKLIYLAVRDNNAGIGECWQQASLLDISRGGASILSAMEAKEGDELKVWIPLEEVDHILEAGTRVIRVSEREDLLKLMGVSFDGLSLPDQEKILDFILKVWQEKKDDIG